jgi:hypothetical protein
MANTTWGGITLAQPDAEDGISISRKRIGGSRRMLSGTLKVDAIATKVAIKLRWTRLSAANWATLLSTYNSYHDASATLVLRDGTSYSVIASGDALTHAETYDAAGTPYYTANLSLDEV